MLLDRLQAELAEDRHEVGQRRTRPAEVHTEAPVVPVGIHGPPERRGDRRRRTEQRGDLAEVGHRLDRAGAGAVLGGRRAGQQVEDPVALLGPERVGDGPPRLFLPGLRDPIDGVSETFEVDVAPGTDAHRDAGERARPDEGLRVAHLARVVLGDERGDRLGERGREPGARHVDENGRPRTDGLGDVEGADDAPLLQPDDVDDQLGEDVGIRVRTRGRAGASRPRS